MELEPKNLQYRTRWFCYLDLLGFRSMVQSKEIGIVVSLYEDVIRTIENEEESDKPLGIYRSWFSDTFILFTRGNSLLEFSHLDNAARRFFRSLIYSKIPVRGAISHGRLYSNQKNNTFIGEALIEAYEYGEKQNWIGLLLCPSVYAALEGTKLHVPERFNYRPVPLDVITHPSPDNVYAYVMNQATESGVNPILSSLSFMRRTSASQFAAKYENSERFIRKYARRSGQKTAI